MHCVNDFAQDVLAFFQVHRGIYRHTASNLRRYQRCKTRLYYTEDLESEEFVMSTASSAQQHQEKSSAYILRFLTHDENELFDPPVHSFKHQCDA